MTFIWGVRHPVLDTPVGTPLMSILDYLMLALGCGMGLVVEIGRREGMEVLMWGTVAWREWGVEVGLPVTTRLPFAVHLMAAS